MQTYPRVSIVIPNHNYSQWVAQAIASAVIDPYPNKEIIVVDDGSTDKSWDVISLYANINEIAENKVLIGRVNDVPVKVFRYKTAGGPSRARNTGIKIGWSSTDIYGFLDSDDEYRPGKIEKSVKLIMEYPEEVGAVYTDYNTVNREGVVRRQYKEPFSRERLLQECIVHSSCLVSKKALEKAGLYDETLRVAEDYDLWLRISENNVIVHIPESLMMVRVGEHSSSSTVSEEEWKKNWKRVMEKVKERWINSV